MQESQTYDDSASYQTKVFFVRYAEEQIAIRDFVRFRTEVDVQSGYLSTEFFLKCELYYAPPPTHNFQMAISSPEVMRDEVVNKGTTVFKCVQTRVFQVNNLLMGLSAYVPLHFDREFTSNCHCTIHGSLIDYRFRVKNYRTDSSGGPLHKDGDTFMENGILVELKYIDLFNNEDSPDTVKRKRHGL